MHGLPENFLYTISKNPESAVNINELEYKLSQRPLSPLFARLAHEYISFKRIGDAKKLLLKGLNIHTEYSTAYFALAECYLHEQNLQAALEAISHALHMNPAVETLQQVQNEIQTLYNGLTTEDNKKPEVQQPSSPEVESDISTNAEVEIPIFVPDLPLVDTPAPTEDAIHDSTQIESITAEIPTLDREEKLPEDRPTEALKEVIPEPSINQELTEILQTTEEDTLPPIPEEEIQPSDQGTLIVEGSETTGEESPALPDSTEYVEQFPPTIEEIPVLSEPTTPDFIETGAPVSLEGTEDVEQLSSTPEETPVPSEQPAISAIDEDLTITESTIQEVPAIEVPEIGGEIPPEELHESTEGSIIAQEIEPTDVSVPVVEEGQEQLSVDEIEKEVPGDELAEPIDRISEPTETETPIGTHESVKAQLPDDEYRIVSKTLAEIYASQAEYGEALMIYRLLKHQRPELGELIDKRIEELEKLLHNNPQVPPQE
jgi:tetratricopeptide (TPR) repeat protein